MYLNGHCSVGKLLATSVIQPTTNMKESIRMPNLDEFINDPWKQFNEMRKTPHECDYDYRLDSSGTIFFEICKLCLDTKGVIEMDK